MDEYNMAHTGAELDDAINKFKSGYIKPSGTLDINENGIRNVKEYESVNVDVQGADVSEVTATEEDVLRGVNFVNSQGQLIEGNIIRQSVVDGVDNYIPFPNQDYLEFSKGYYPNDFRIKALLQEKTVSPKLLLSTFVEPDTGYALKKVTVQGYTIPDDYIAKALTELYVTQSANGEYTANGDTNISNISVNIGFKPKVFYLVVTNGIATKETSEFAMNASFLITDNDYKTLVKNTAGIYYQSSNGARSAQSVSESNTFVLTENGVKGGNGTNSSFYLQSGKKFNWYAWG